MRGSEGSFPRSSGSTKRAAAPYGKVFSDSNDEQQISVLASSATEGSAGWPHLTTVKQLTAGGYYRSEVGMVQELGFEGMTFVTTFDGCQHPEHHAFVPPGRDDASGA